MKYLTLLFSLSLLVFTSCKKDQPTNPINSDGTVDVQKISIKTILPVFKNDLSVRTGGNASIDLSKFSSLEFGVCYGEDRSPSENDSKIVASSSSGGDFEVLISYHEFKSEQLYTRAYVKDLNTKSIKYGDEQKIIKDDASDQFTDDIKKAIIQTLIIKDNERLKITSEGSVNMDLSKYTSFEYGFCYGLKSNPTVFNDLSAEAKLKSKNQFEGDIDFSNPTVPTIYYLRAYIINTITMEVYYGEEIQYTVNPIEYLSDNIKGKYVGRHKWNIPVAILQALSDAFPLDENGNKPDLTEGFLDTLTFIHNGNKEVTIHSTAYEKNFKGKIVGDNAIKIEKNENSFEVVYLDGYIEMKNFTISTNKDIELSSSAINSTNKIEMRITTTKLLDFNLPLDIITLGNFVRIE